MAKWGMVIDLDKCTGCQACSAACEMENNTLPGNSWHEVLYYRDGAYPNGRMRWLPRPCMQCESPSCVAVCPTGAAHKDNSVGGIVAIDWDKCIGCKYCMMACPYGVLTFADGVTPIEPNLADVFPGEKGQMWSPPYQKPQQDRRKGVGIPPEGVVSKCNFCYHKVVKAPAGVADLDEDNPATKELTPSCVRTCPPKARFFGDLDNPSSNISRMIVSRSGVRLKEYTGNRPQVYYLGAGIEVAGYK